MGDPPSIDTEDERTYVTLRPYGSLDRPNRAVRTISAPFDRFRTD